MPVSKDIVTEVLEEQNFEILSMEPIPEKHTTRLIVVHDIHPENEVFVDLVSIDENGEEVLEMQFTGPDEWTDEEAKQCLQDVMNTLVKIIETTNFEEILEAASKDGAESMDDTPEE